MKKTVLAYLAGIIDGEGNIAIQTRGPGVRGSVTRAYVAALKVSNIDMRMLVWIKKQTGLGSISTEKKRGGNRRRCHLWVCSAIATESILREVYPYLIIKKDQADLMFKFRETFRTPATGQKPTPPKTVMVRKKYFEQMKALHKMVLD